MKLIHCRSAAVTILLISSIVFPAQPAEAQNRAAAFNALSGLWSGTYKCARPQNKAGRFDMFVGKRRRLKDGRLYQPLAVIRHYLINGKAITYDQEIVSNILTGGKLGLAIRFTGFRRPYTLKIVKKGNSRLIISNHPFCSRANGSLVLRRFATPREPRKLLGLWSGGFVGCRFTDELKAQIIVSPFDGKRLLADLEYKFKGTVGRLIFVGAPAKEGGRFKFKMLRLGLKRVWGGKKREGTDWLPGDAIFEVNPSTGRLKVEAGSCTAGEFLRPNSGSTSRVRPVSVSTSVKVTGDWEGRLLCGRNNRINQDLILNISKSLAGRYKSTLATYRRWSSTGSIYWQGFIGEKERGKASYFFAKTNRKLHGLKGANVRSFRITKLAPGSLQLELSDKGCKSITMSPVPRTAYTEQALLPSSKRSGTWNTARSRRQKCEALIAWAEPFFRLKGASRNKVDYSLLYTDRSFMPVFGVPYDTLSPSFLKRHYHKKMDYGRLCTSDPIIKARFNNAERAYGVGFSYGEDKIYYIRRQIRRNRAAIHKVETLQKKYSEVRSVSATALLNDIEKVLKSSSAIMWPGTVNSALDWVSKRRLEAMDQMIASEIARVRKAETPEDRLVQSKIIFGKRWTPKQLTNDRKAKLVGAMKEIHRLAAAELLDGRIAALKVTPPWDKALQAVVEGKKYLVSLKGRLLPEAFVQYDARIGKSRGQILRAVFAEELGQLDDAGTGVQAAEKTQEVKKKFLAKFGDYQSEPAFKASVSEFDQKYEELLNKAAETKLSILRLLSADKKGLEASRNWLSVFKKEFAAHSRAAPVIAARTTYRSVRRRQLRGAINAFKQEISQTAFEKRPELLSSYLSWLGDKRQPVSIEYHLELQLLSP